MMEEAAKATCGSLLHQWGQIHCKTRQAAPENGSDKPYRANASKYLNTAHG